MRLATVDVGTNTALLLVVEAAGPEDVRVLEDRAEITRLGRGIGSGGQLQPDAIARTLAALRQYGEVARRHRAPVVAVGTEALRRAPNAAAFLEPAAEALGAPLEVIDGDREARLSFLAAASAFPAEAAGTVVVVDIGGGSTEVIVAQGGTVALRTSLPLGSVRLVERHFRHDPPGADEVQTLLAEVRSAIDGIALPGPNATLIGIAGTVTTLAAMSLGLTTYDAARVHGHKLGRTSLDGVIEVLSRSTQAERERMPGLDPKRADVIAGGAYVLRELATRIGVPEILVSDRGVRWGLLYERLAATS